MGTVDPGLSLRIQQCRWDPGTPPCVGAVGDHHRLPLMLPRSDELVVLRACRSQVSDVGGPALRPFTDMVRLGPQRRIRTTRMRTPSVRGKHRQTLRLTGQPACSTQKQRLIRMVRKNGQRLVGTHCKPQRVSDRQHRTGRRIDQARAVRSRRPTRERRQPARILPVGLQVRVNALRFTVLVHLGVWLPLCCRLWRALHLAG